MQGDTAYPLTFAFCLYDEERTRDCRTCLTNWYSGNIIHCETYDHMENTATFISSGTETVKRCPRFYGDGWIFVTVLLTRAQRLKMYNYYNEKISMEQTFSSLHLYLFPFKSCFLCKSDRHITCSELVIGMMEVVWNLKLHLPREAYSPMDVYEILISLVNDGIIIRSQFQKNPSEIKNEDYTNYEIE